MNHTHHTTTLPCDPGSHWRACRYSQGPRVKYATASHRQQSVLEQLDKGESATHEMDAAAVSE